MTIRLCEQTQRNTERKMLCKRERKDTKREKQVLYNKQSDMKRKKRDVWEGIR